MKSSHTSKVDLPAGKVIIKEGDSGREFIVLREGTADVERGGKKIDTIGPGDFVGEIALIAKTPRTATVTTTSPARLLVIRGRDFNRVLSEAPSIAVKILRQLGGRLAPESW